MMNLDSISFKVTGVYLRKHHKYEGMEEVLHNMEKYLMFVKCNDIFVKIPFIINN